MNHDTTTRDGQEYPTPGKWVLNWIEGDVISWRHDPDEDARIHDGPTAHAFITHNPFGSVHEVRVEVGGDTVDVIDVDTFGDRADLLARVGDVLAEHEPT